jgi:polyhydroxybutyrate depolymerase
MSPKKSGIRFLEGKTKSGGGGLHMFTAILLLISSAACGQSAARPTATPAPTMQTGDSTRTLAVGSLERNYLLHIPPGLDSQRPAPVVFVFHGYTMTADIMPITTGFNAVADTGGFLVVYPNGISRSWNGTGCCGDAVNKNIDDLAFVRQMLKDLGTITRIDPRRIYASGFSNGAVFSYRLACEMSDTFAAVAPVSGWLTTNPCQPEQPVSIVHVHGTKDAYEGQTWTPGDVGTTGTTAIIVPSVEQAIATWAQLDGCSGAAQVEKQGIITHTIHSSCQAGTAVELYAIEGGTHTWPSLYAFPTASTQMIWNFFKAHPKP